jgi:predicted DsbA family dithiol-disulfide isomerase
MSYIDVFIADAVFWLAESEFADHLTDEEFADAVQDRASAQGSWSKSELQRVPFLSFIYATRGMVRPSTIASALFASSLSRKPASSPHRRR